MLLHVWLQRLPPTTAAPADSVASPVVASDASVEQPSPSVQKIHDSWDKVVHWNGPIPVTSDDAGIETESSAKSSLPDPKTLSGEYLAACVAEVERRVTLARLSKQH